MLSLVALLLIVFCWDTMPAMKVSSGSWLAAEDGTPEIALLSPVRLATVP